MTKAINLKGERFGRLLVIERATGTHLRKGVHWLCRCNCGTEKIIASDLLRSKETKSCGCLKKDAASIAHFKHGYEGTPTYICWVALKFRCLNKDYWQYQDYGDRGISVCDRWLVFENFLADMGERPKEKSIGRIDNDGPYDLLNCRWETRSQQARNTRATVLNEDLVSDIRARVALGERKTDIARSLGLKRHNIQDATDGRSWK